MKRKLSAVRFSGGRMVKNTRTGQFCFWGVQNMCLFSLLHFQPFGTCELFLKILKWNIDSTYHIPSLQFQQDGTPPHCVPTVREFLNFRFPGQWILTRGPIEWIARTLDLNPFVFSLGTLKSKCFATQQNSLDDLRQRIETEYQRVTTDA